MCLGPPQTKERTPKYEEHNEDTNLTSHSTAENYKSVDDPSIVNVDSQHLVKRNYAASTAALCLCNLTQAYLLINVFPYAGYMAIHLVAGINEENAGSRAGFIASSFMFGRMLTSYYWGKVADIYGRKATLITSLFLSSVFSIIFGLSTSFKYAIISRLLLGMTNCIIGIVKTVVTEMAHGDEELEAKSTGLVIGMRSWGFLISPAIGGFLADPLKQYPKSSLVRTFESFLSTYPFSLPNIFGALLCLGSMIATIVYVEETLPTDKLRSIRHVPQDLQESLRKMWVNASCRTNVQSDIEEGETEKFAKEGPEKDSIKKSDKEIISMFWSNRKTRILFIVYWIYSCLSCGIDEVFPLFCLSTAAGLGLSASAIGNVLASSGVLFAILQYVVYRNVMKHFGMYTSLKVSVLFGIFTVLLFPISVTLNEGASSGALNNLTYFYLTIIMAVQKIASCMFFALCSIATNKTVPVEYRGTMNGFNLVGGSLFKALGPVAFGSTLAYLLSSGIISPLLGSFLTFIFISSFGVILLMYLRELSVDVEEEVMS